MKTLVMGYFLCFTFELFVHTVSLTAICWCGFSLTPLGGGVKYQKIQLIRHGYVSPFMTSVMAFSLSDMRLEQMRLHIAIVNDLIK